MTNPYQPHPSYYGYPYGPPQAPPGYVRIYPTPQYGGHDGSQPAPPHTPHHAPHHLPPHQQLESHGRPYSTAPAYTGLVHENGPSLPTPPVTAPPELPHESSTSQSIIDDDGDDSPGPTGSNQDAPTDRGHRYTDEGVAEMIRQWQIEWSDKPMPPPSPGVFPTKEAGIESAKKFAKINGYTLIIGHSFKDNHGNPNRMLMKCQYGGKVRSIHQHTPELRQRNRVSRKTGCPMKIRLQRRRYSTEWVLCVTEGVHNHASDKGYTSVAPSVYPDLEAALHDWHMNELSRGEVVHGNTLKSKALALYAEMVQYRGHGPPNLDRRWLDQYRLRYNLPGRTSRPPGPPELVDWTDADAAAAATDPIGVLGPRSREHIAFSGLETVFEDPTLLNAVKDTVREYMSRYDQSHDWDHILRVVSIVKRILRKEMQPFGPMHCDPKITYLAAMCHDLGDHKYAKPDENVDNQIAELLLASGAPAELALKVQLIARNVSFSNEVKNPRMVKAVMDQHPELAIVQDADRIDAIGAVGIGRTFAFTGAQQPDQNMAGTIEHFKEKLERLESMMKTDTGRQIARERTERLQQFRQWWEEEYAVVE